MLKRTFLWLKRLFCGGPNSLSFSSLLPGQGGDSGESSPQMSRMEMLKKRLNRAEAYLDINDYPDAQRELVEADHLSAEFQPHTREFEDCLREKTRLWERLNAHLKR